MTQPPQQPQPQQQQQRQQQQAAPSPNTAEIDGLVETRTRELAALSTHLQNHAEKEKSELARTLHDELGGLLTAAKMDLSWLQSRLDTPAHQERLTQLGSVLDEAMSLKRRVVEELRPSLLDHFGLATALRAYVEATCNKAGIPADMRLPDESEAIPADLAITLFRIVQEGLINIIRHAQATHVTLEFAAGSAGYAITLQDDGHGFDPHSTQGQRQHGIMGMQHRVRALGGSFSLESKPGQGTTLTVTLPRTAA